MIDSARLSVAGSAWFNRLDGAGRAVAEDAVTLFRQALSNGMDVADLHGVVASAVRSALPVLGDEEGPFVRLTLPAFLADVVDQAAAEAVAGVRSAACRKRE